jgi:hypothetical protein
MGFLLVAGLLVGSNLGNGWNSGVLAFALEKILINSEEEQ